MKCDLILSFDEHGVLSEPEYRGIKTVHPSNFPDVLEAVRFFREQGRCGGEVAI